MSHSVQRPVRRLRTALLANAVFSAVSALVFLAAAGPVARLSGATRADILFTGVGTAVFVVLLVVAITRRDLTRRGPLALAVVIASLDVLWVLGTPAGLARYTPAGMGLLAGIALVVAVLAAVQIWSLVEIFRGLRGGAEARAAR